MESEGWVHFRSLGTGTGLIVVWFDVLVTISHRTAIKHLQEAEGWAVNFTRICIYGRDV